MFYFGSQQSRRTSLWLLQLCEAYNITLNSVQVAWQGAMGTIFFSEMQISEIWAPFLAATPRPKFISVGVVVCVWLRMHFFGHCHSNRPCCWLWVFPVVCCILQWQMEQLCFFVLYWELHITWQLTDLLLLVILQLQQDPNPHFEFHCFRELWEPSVTGTISNGECSAFSSKIILSSKIFRILWTITW